MPKTRPIVTWPAVMKKQVARNALTRLIFFGSCGPPLPSPQHLEIGELTLHNGVARERDVLPLWIDGERRASQLTLAPLLAGMCFPTGSLKGTPSID